MVEGQPFRRELPGWLLRGGVCALPSAGLALCVIRPSVASVGGMLTGFALVVAAFAAACSRLDPDGPPWGRPLRIAAWIRAGLGVWPGLYLDMLTGGLLMTLFRVDNARGVGRFVLVLLTTLAQGALVALEVFLLATVLLLSTLVRR